MVINRAYRDLNRTIHGMKNIPSDVSKDFQLERYLGQIAEIEMQVMSARTKKEILVEEDRN